MFYSSGHAVEIGDKVLIERGRTKAMVEYVLESDQALIRWGLEANGEFGVLMKTANLGLVFWPIEDLFDPVVLVEKTVTQPSPLEHRHK